MQAKNRRKMYCVIVYHLDNSSDDKQFFHEYGRSQEIKKLLDLYKNKKIKGYSTYEFYKDLK